MSDAPLGEYEDESGSNGESRSGGVGRSFLSLLILGLATATAVLAYLKDGEFFQELLTKDAWNAQLIGNLHPVMMLLPLGLIVMVVLVEVLGWLSFGRWKPATVSVLFFVVITTVLASLSGLVLMELEGNNGTDWIQYMWYGIGATVAFALSFICKIWGKDGNDRGIVYAVFLLAGAGALGYGGYIFGQKVHAFTLIPSKTELTTPFGNQTIKSEMSASILELEASEAVLESEVDQKKVEITGLSAAKKAAEDRYLAEQKKLAAAEKSIVGLKANVSAAQKMASETQKQVDQANAKVKGLEAKAAEAQKQIEAGNQEKAKVQKEVEDLKVKVEALNKEKVETPEALPE